MGHVTPWAPGPGRCVDAANWADTRPWKSGTLNIKINSSYSHANYSDPKQTLFNISLGSIINLNLKCLDYILYEFWVCNYWWKQKCFENQNFGHQYVDLRDSGNLGLCGTNSHLEQSLQIRQLLQGHLCAPGLLFSTLPSADMLTGQIKTERFLRLNCCAIIGQQHIENISRVAILLTAIRPLWPERKKKGFRLFKRFYNPSLYVLNAWKFCIWDNRDSVAIVLQWM